MSKFIELLSDLAKDPDKLLKFRRDPQPVMEYYGLTDKEKEALMSGDQEKLTKFVNDKVDSILPENSMKPNG